MQRPHWWFQATHTVSRKSLDLAWPPTFLFECWWSWPDGQLTSIRQASINQHRFTQSLWHQFPTSYISDFSVFKCLYNPSHASCRDKNRSDKTPNWRLHTIRPWRKLAPVRLYGSLVEELCQPHSPFACIHILFLSFHLLSFILNLKLFSAIISTRFSLFYFLVNCMLFWPPGA